MHRQVRASCWARRLPGVVLCSWALARRIGSGADATLCAGVWVIQCVCGWIFVLGAAQTTMRAGALRTVWTPYASPSLSVRVRAWHIVMHAAAEW